MQEIQELVERDDQQIDSTHMKGKTSSNLILEYALSILLLQC